MKKTEKSHDTGLRIMEVLKILMKEDVNKDTIIDKLKDKEDFGNVYTHEAYLKYFNTFNVLGLDVQKIPQGFTLKNALIKTDLTLKEQKILIKLLSSIKKLNNKKKEETIKKFFMKLDKYINFEVREELNHIENEPCSENIKLNLVNTLKKMISEELNVTLTYKNSNGNEETIDVELKQIKETKGVYYVLCYVPKLLRTKRIYLDSITSLKQNHQKIKGQMPVSNVIFEVYGRLSKSYKLKDGEALVDFGTNFMRISNTKEDLESLMLRLLKYGENCKIIKPKNLIEDFLALTDNVLQNLEGDNE